MENLDRIKAKIKALLSRTVERGATENEANVALEKATKLMTEYQINQFDLKNYSDNEIIEKTIIVNRKSVFLRSLIASIARGFDCESFYYSGNKGHEEVIVFGYKTDVEIVEYFSDFILKACQTEISKYKESEDFECLIRFYSPQKIINSFIGGFTYRIQQKVKDLKTKKTLEIEKSTGTNLICLKNEMIKRSFDEKHSNLKSSYYRPPKSLQSAFKSGDNSAKGVSLNNGVNQGRNSLLIGCS